MSQNAAPSTERVAVLGLGYVGLPVALGFARHFPTVGFDINSTRVSQLRAGHDHTLEVERATLDDSAITFSDDLSDLAGSSFFIVTVPTPIDNAHRPDLGAIRAASRTVGAALQKGAVVVYESTVYPGVTEEICGPILEEVSGLKCGVDFTLGYSPERINPGDKEHTLERIIKVVSGQDAATLDRVAHAYGKVVTAGVHRAPTIQVAEAAKVIENTQRDLNIALMNELALVFERMGIRTVDVLEAAGTKWNFLRFTPGLVGGHCIGVDPYYLTHKAEQLGYTPRVILAGRRINDEMGGFVATCTVKAMAKAGLPVGSDSKVAVIGLSFKENVPDLRNSRVPDILDELGTYGITPLVTDPMASADQALHEYGIQLAALDVLQDLDALILAVPHRQLMTDGGQALLKRLKPNGIVYDVKSVLSPTSIPSGLTLLSL
ncbi:MAG: nucleotide sugar dehydrogenase [Rhodobacterales bacterium]|nr:nucleotide sugar dehydrogenase [Rhodobacterales bacterium]